MTDDGTAAVTTGVTRLRQRLPLAARATGRELLELDVLETDELETNLADLARLNRLPGGVGASVTAIARLVASPRFGHADTASPA